MKRKLKFLGMIVFTGALMLSVSSCKKDKDKGPQVTPEVESFIALLKSNADKSVTDASISADNKTVTINWSDGTTTKSPLLEDLSVTETGDGFVVIKFWDGIKQQEFKLKLAPTPIPDPTITLLGWISGYSPGASFTVNGTDDLNFEYVWVNEIRNRGAGMWGMTNSNTVTWNAGTSGGRYTLLKNRILTDIETKAVVIGVSPATADVSQAEFKLQNTNQLISAFDLAKAQKATTSTTSGSAMWVLPLKERSTTYSNFSSFTALFGSGTFGSSSWAPYIWAVTGGITSNYSQWKFSFKNMPAPAQSYVVEAGGKNPSEGSVGAASSPMFDVEIDNWYNLSFVNSIPVFDYYIEADNNTDANLFGFEVNRLDGTFRITKYPNPTLATSMTLNVSALQLDGADDCAYVGKTKINIRTTGDAPGYTTYNLGTVVISDGMTDATQDNVWPAGITGRLPALAVNLNQMFADLKPDNTAIWRSPTLGAANLATIVNDVVIRQGTTTVTFSFIGATIPTLIEFTKSDGSATTSPADAANMRMRFNYSNGSTAAISGGTAAPTFEPGKPYSLIVNFKNSSNAVLNTIIINFTPVLPDFNSYITKVPEFWDNNQTTLYGYFRESTPIVASQPWKPAIYNVMTDGGFSKIGSELTRNYLGIKFETDPDQGGTGSNNVRRFIQSITTGITIGAQAASSPSNASTIQWGMGEFGATANISELYNGAPGATENRAANRYYGNNAGAPVNIVVSALTKYINVYPVDFDGELDFRLRLASAVERGTLVGAKGTATDPMLVVPYSGTQVSLIYADDLVAKNYNNQTYVLFPEWRGNSTGFAAYSYTYIKEVTVSIPASEAANNYYTITDKNGNSVTGGLVPGAWNTADNKAELAYVGVRPGNMSGDTNTLITFTVTDVFGFSKSFEVKLRFIQQ